MAAKTCDLNFGGYWREPKVGGIPAESGVYGVYAAIHNADGTVTLNRLIYIGESRDVRGRVASHEKWPLWRHQIRQGEIICFNMASIGPDADRVRAEAAMIYEHKPVCNEEYVNSFPFEQTSIITRGQNALMQVSFMVYTTQRTGLYGLAAQRW